MYPLLRELESRGLVEGLGAPGEAQPAPLQRHAAPARPSTSDLMAALEPFLDSIVESITLIKREVRTGSARRSRQQG